GKKERWEPHSPATSWCEGAFKGEYPPGDQAFKKKFNEQSSACSSDLKSWAFPLARCGRLPVEFESRQGKQRTQAAANPKLAVGPEAQTLVRNWKNRTFFNGSYRNECQNAQIFTSPTRDEQFDTFSC